MTTRMFRNLMIATFFLLSCSGSHAQQADTEAVEEINRILNLEEQRQEQERREIRERQRTHTVIPSKKPPEYEILAPGDQACFDITEIAVEGVSLLDKDAIEAAIKSYRGQCLGIAEINQIISAITSLYINAGYVTSRAYIPPQNLRSGRLLIEVIEGFVEAIRVEGGPTRLASTAWPGAVGEPLNLRMIEQGLDQVNRLSSARAHVQFLPGEKVGGTIVVITYRKNALLVGSIGRNNSGQPSTGKQQITASLQLQSPLGLSDHLYLTAQADIKDDHQGKKSESAGLNYTVPYGYWTFSLGYNQFEYMNRVQGANTTFLSRGNSQTERFNARRLLFRDQNQKISATGLFKHQKNDNYIEDVKLENSSVDYFSAEIGFDYEHYLPGNKTFIGTLTYSRGLGGNGSAAQDAIYSEDFQKVNLDATYSDYTRWLEGTWRWSSSVHGQYGRGDLYSGETFSIGSQYTVRGFKQDGLTDSGGAYWRNEISTTYFPIERNPRFYVNPYLAADAGVIAEGESLSGWAAGLRVGGKYFRSEVTYGRPISAPVRIDKSESVVNFSFVLSAGW